MNLNILTEYRIKWFARRPNHWNSKGYMDEWMGRSVTIEKIWTSGGVKIGEDNYRWTWRATDFEEINGLNEFGICEEDFEL
jgi:hypothetical protein